MDDIPFQALRSIWQNEKPPRVWSLLLTLFGDLAQDPKAHLSGAAVNQILKGIGIKPEAIRVALHRLRQDGWIQSTKVGRTSNYSLTPWGLAECASANAQIYGACTPSVDTWLVATNPGTTGPIATDAMVQIGPDLFISPTHIENDTALVLPFSAATPVPAWVSDRLCPPDLQTAASTFGARLQSHQNATKDDLTALQITILRTIIVHEWRRIILRIPTVPETLLPVAWQNLSCKARVQATLDQLPKPSLTELNGISPNGT